MKAEIEHIRIGFWGCYFHSAGDEPGDGEDYQDAIGRDLPSQPISTANVVNTWANILAPPGNIRLSSTWGGNPNFLAAAGGHHVSPNPVP